MHEEIAHFSRVPCISPSCGPISAAFRAIKHSSPLMLWSAILAKKRRMGEIQEQLALLRERIARIDLKFNGPSAPRPRSALEDCLAGAEVETAYGRHFETE